MEEVESAPEWLIQRLCTENEEQLVVIAKTLSGIWFARNRRMWEGKHPDSGTTMALSLKQITEWQVAQKKIITPITEHAASVSQCVKWEPPDTGWYKVNVDASVFEGQPSFSIGMVLYALLVAAQF